MDYHSSFDTCHLVNWIKQEKEGKLIPPMTLDTDDADIFATDIYNEYCHIYTLLVYEYDFYISETFEIIRKVNRDANYYIFNNDSLYTADE